MKHIFLAGMTLSFLLVIGCQVVHVTDQQGKAIRWADVTAISQDGSAMGISVKTDLMGNATLPMSQSAPGTREWLEVRKQGYLTRRIIRPEDGRVEVQLLQAPGAARKENAQTK